MSSGLAPSRIAPRLVPPWDTRNRLSRERPRRAVLYPPVKPGGMSFLSLRRRTNVSPGFTVFVFSLARSSAVDPATRLYRARASREHDLSAPTRSRTAPDLAASRGGAPDDLPPRKFTRADRRRGGAATRAPRNLPAGPPSCALFLLQNKPISTHSTLSWGREISSPGAAVIARSWSIPTSLGRPVEPCGAPARRWRTTPATSPGCRIFTDMVERHPVAGLGVAPASSLSTRRVLPQRAGDVRSTMSELAAQPRSGLAARARACSREVPREPRRRSPSHEIRRPGPSAHRRSPRTGVALERRRRTPPALSSRLALSVAGIEAPRTERRVASPQW